ncbi:MAG: hypothetical protein CL928_12375 [Deltaproteobacteria bacterium]|nr:hypothetical protein [Deltaproteobacteria bacterium]
MSAVPFVETPSPTGPRAGLKLGLCAALLMLCTAPSALAAQRTAVAPMLRGNANFSYQGVGALVRLRDRQGVHSTLSEVGSYSRIQQSMLIAGEFSPYHGIGLHLDVPVVFYDRIHWAEARSIRFDPDGSMPTMAGGSTLSQDVLDSSASSRLHAGLGDIAFGLRLVPFAERGVPGRKAPASLALDATLRFPSGGHHDKVRDDGNAGPGVGGMGIRVGASASRRLPGAEAYLSIHYSHNAAYKVELLDTEGQPIPPLEEEEAVVLRPADTFEMRFGAEIVALEQTDEGRSVLLDIGLGATYQSPGEVSSGTLLPAPLPETKGHPATTAEHLVLDGAIEVRIRPMTQLEFHVGFQGLWRSPHNLERITATAYSTQTAPDSFWTRWTTGARVRFR